MPWKRKEKKLMDKGTIGSDSMGKMGRITIVPCPPSASAAMQTKAEEINLILLQPQVDLWRLRELALSEGGLVNGKFY
jgi:hypothetical protein